MTIAIIIFVLGFLIGGLSMWILIRQYRKALGINPDPFDEGNTYLI